MIIGVKVIIAFVAAKQPQAGYQIHQLTFDLEEVESVLNKQAHSCNSTC